MLDAAHLRSVYSPPDGACFYWSVLLLTSQHLPCDIDTTTYQREPRPMQGISAEALHLMGKMRALRRHAVEWIRTHPSVLNDDPDLTCTFPQYIAKRLNRLRTSHNTQDREAWFTLRPCTCNQPPPATRPASAHETRCTARLFVGAADAMRLATHPTLADPHNPMHPPRLQREFERLGPVLPNSPGPQHIHEHRRAINATLDTHITNMTTWARTPIMYAVAAHLNVDIATLDQKDPSPWLMLLTPEDAPNPPMAAPLISWQIVLTRLHEQQHVHVN